MAGCKDITAHILTMGCAKNEVDSAHMANCLMEAGITLVDDPACADAIIVNTCSFIQSATEESLEAIFDMLGLDNVARGDAHVIVAGCMPARYGEELADSLIEVKTFLPCSDEGDIASVVQDLLKADRAKVQSKQTLLPGESYALAMPGEGPSVYVKISDGCDRFCSYCTIPFIRGRYHSFPYERIRQKVSELTDAGAREVVLIAQDTGRWGEDLSGQHDLAWLMEHLAEEFRETWFRVMYLQPEGITDALLKCIATHRNVAPYLDIPLQHVDSSILKDMNRRGSADDFSRLIRHVRECVPDLTLRTTLIAGFPGETQAQFEAMCDFIEEAEFDYVGVFPYSQEEGTRAAKLPGQIDDDIKVERAQIVRDVADGISEARIRQRIGKSMDVLVLGCEDDGQLYGRAMCQAPEVDGVVYLEQGEPGQIVNVTICDTLMYEMEGE